ncbi:mitoferrin-2-like isoform X2 [Pseudoliparis swirei]|uniref:mitoferrin-2-like isoform X2 n=1 Tax=Pseudoliparis swirei TaxID=2059687 RepID=UPI0024BD6A49|nr:mitoferrin-2-like isoform X2 [Pseudoliparis swirei]
MDTPGVDSRVTGAAAGAELRWMGGRLLDATGGFVGSLSPRMPGEQDFSPALHRLTPPENSTSAEPEIDYERLPQGAATGTHMLAGSVAGIMEHCVMYPIDCVKTRMQSLHPEPGARYRNVMDALRQIVRTEGVWRPIRGVNVLAVGAGPAHALYFACYEKIKFSLGDAIHPGANSHFSNGVAGCMATLLHDGIMNPAEGAALHGLRVAAGAAEPAAPLPPRLPRGGRRARRGARRRRHHAARRLQDAPQHAGGSGGGGLRLLRAPHLRPRPGLPDGVRDGRRPGLLQRLPGAHHLPDAVHRHQLVRVRVLQVPAHPAAARPPEGRLGAAGRSAAAGHQGAHRQKHDDRRDTPLVFREETLPG